MLPRAQIENWEELCKQYNFILKHTVVAGGINRFGSVKNGLAKIDEGSIVAIHDGVRPLVSKNLINFKLLGATKKGNGIVPIVAVKDSIRKVEG